MEQFRVKLEDAVMVQGDDLRGTVVACFEKVGVPTEDAALAADVLVNMKRSHMIYAEHAKIGKPRR